MTFETTAPAIEHPRSVRTGRASTQGRVRRGGPERLLRRLQGRPRREPRGPPARDHRVHRPVGLRQVHRAALLRPHERPHPVGPGRGQDHVPRRRPLRLPDRPRRGAQADRHGLPEAEPLPQVDLRQHRLRAPARRAQGQPRRPSREGPAPGGAVGRGQGPPAEVGHGPLRWPAAAALHRPGRGGRARGRADGRAVLGPRPHRHGPHRGSDAGAQEPSTRSSSSPTTCSRPPGSAIARRSSPPRSTTRATPARASSWSTTPPTRSSRRPADERTENYVTGRFG